MSDEFKRRDVFNKAADLVQEGWCKGRMQSRRYGGEEMSYCAVGAVLKASGYYDGHSDPDWEVDESQHVPADHWFRLRERLMGFNDALARDKTDVVKVLREVAATGTFKLEHTTLP